MKTTIEIYRTIEIWFDTGIESFQCDIDDERSIKKSYPAIKKFIDEWLKDNETFKPFKVEKNPLSVFGGGKSGKIIGIRKDGRFIIELHNGKKEQISDYNLDGHIIYTHENKKAWDLLNELNEEEERINNEIREKKKNIKSMFQITTLKDYKKSLNNL